MQFIEKKQYQGNVLPCPGCAEACGSQTLTLGIFLSGFLLYYVETGVSVNPDLYSSAMLASWQAPGIFWTASRRAGITGTPHHVQLLGGCRGLKTLSMLM